MRPAARKVTRRAGASLVLSAKDKGNPRATGILAMPTAWPALFGAEQSPCWKFTPCVDFELQKLLKAVSSSSAITYPRGDRRERTVGTLHFGRDDSRDCLRLCLASSDLAGRSTGPDRVGGWQTGDARNRAGRGRACQAATRSCGSTVDRPRSHHLPDLRQEAEAPQAPSGGGARADALRLPRDVRAQERLPDDGAELRRDALGDRQADRARAAEEGAGAAPAGQADPHRLARAQAGACDRAAGAGL